MSHEYSLPDPEDQSTGFSASEIFAEGDPGEVLALAARDGLEETIGELRGLKDAGSLQSRYVKNRIRGFSFAGFRFEDVEQRNPIDDIPVWPTPPLNYSIDVTKADHDDMDLYRVAYERSVRGEEEASARTEHVFAFSDGGQLIDYSYRSNTFTDDPEIVYELPEWEMVDPDELEEDAEEAEYDELDGLYDEDDWEEEELPAFEEVIEGISNEDVDALLSFVQLVDGVKRAVRFSRAEIQERT